MKELNARNLIFILWLILLAFPLFSEMDFLGIKIKKEVDKATEELKSSINLLFSQINSTNSVSGSMTVNNYNVSGPLASKQEMDELLEEHGLKNQTKDENEDTLPDEDRQFLIDVHNKIQIKILSILDKLTIHNIYPIGSKELDILMNFGIFDTKEKQLITEIVSITNRAFSKELISPYYIDFVKTSKDTALQYLDKALQNLKYFVHCPKCHYMGYSTSENYCPNCSSVFIDD